MRKTLSPTSLASAADIGDRIWRLEQMRDCIIAVRQAGHLHYALLNLVTTFIDGLASGKEGDTKKAYLKYLQDNFPRLCSEISPRQFYAFYRCKAVHQFGLGEGYAIGRDSPSLNGTYVAEQLFTEVGKTITVLNIDMLVEDFLTHLDEKISQERAIATLNSRPSSAPR